MDTNRLLWSLAGLASAVCVWIYSVRKDNFRPTVGMFFIGLVVTLVAAVVRNAGLFMFGLIWSFAFLAVWGYIAQKQ